MLAHALAAGLPLIHASGADPIFIEQSLNALVPKHLQVREYGGGRARDTVYYSLTRQELSPKGWATLYSDLEAKDSCVVLTCDEYESSPLIFNAGPICTPPEVIERILKAWGVSDEGVRIAVSGLLGTQIAALLRLASVRGGITASNITSLRRLVQPHAVGLQSVEVEYGREYIPDPRIVRWVKVQKRVWPYEELRSRGLLFVGPPGTGKTMAAKYVARTFDMPLYRYDVGSTLSKWVGESERNLKAALQSVDQSAPCVLLFDEAEKLFSESSEDEHHVSRNLLSELLWWLQEHRSPVIVLMTSNHPRQLPPELIRPGRLDGVVRFKPLPPGAAVRRLARGRIRALPREIRPPLEAVALPEGPATPAEVAQAVLDAARARAGGKTVKKPTASQTA